MKIKKLLLGNMQTNCYVVSNDDHHCFVIDPGSIGKKVVNYLEENQLILDAILLTHGHFDHIGAVDYLYERYHVDIYIHEEDIALLHDEKKNLSAFEIPFVVEAPVKPAPHSFSISGFHIEWLHLPGHCPGSSMIYLPEQQILFSGDVLFAGSIGRFDFVGSSRHETRQTLEKIKGYSFDATVYPGHGEATTLLKEKMTNPYLK